MKTRIISKRLLNFITGFYFILFLSVLLSLLACGRNNSIDSTISKISPPPKPPTMIGSDTIWQMKDEIPLLTGSDKLLMNYIMKNIKYPESAKANGIQGQVVVKISISSRGIITKHEIIKSVNPDLDAEALRVLKSLTKFEPAWLDGNPVSASYNIPITFKLN